VTEVRLLADIGKGAGRKKFYLPIRGRPEERTGESKEGWEFLIKNKPLETLIEGSFRGSQFL